MARIVVPVSADRMGRDLAFGVHHGLHLLMDFLTMGLWVPIHIRSTRKVKRAMSGRTPAMGFQQGVASKPGWYRSQAGYLFWDGHRWVQDSQGRPVF